MPPWPCPLCGYPGAPRRAVDDGSPGMSRGPQPASASSTGTAQPVQRHPFNPLTAIHGEFIPGAPAWRADRRSRRIRAIERNRLRAEEAEREAERVRTTV